MKKYILSTIIFVLICLQIDTNAFASEPLDQWNFDVIDTAIDITWPSIQVDSQGYPHIAYTREDIPTQVITIAYAYFNGFGWAHSTVMESSDLNTACYLALNSSDEPCILFTADDGDYHLCHAIPSGGGGWSVDTVVTSSLTLYLDCLAMGPDDNPRCVYDEIDWQGTAGKDHYYLYFDGADWQQELLYEYCIGIFVGCPSMAVASDGTVHISEYRGDEFISYLYHLERIGGTWETEVLGEIYGSDTDIALTSAGNPCIVYISSNEVMYGWYNGSSWSHTPVDPIHDFSRDCVLAIDGSDMSHIAFYDKSGFDLRYAWGSGSSFSNMTLDSTGWVGTCSDIAVDGAGNPFIVYNDRTNDQLKLAWYGDPTGFVEEEFGYSGSLAAPFISPNPAGDMLSIEISLAAPGPVRISIFDMNGRLVMESSSIECPGGISQIYEDISELETGIYIVRVSDGVISVAERVTVIRSQP